VKTENSRKQNANKIPEIIKINLGVFIEKTLKVNPKNIAI
jgi:hypothetical protein